MKFLINSGEKIITISAFNFGTLYVAILHNILLKVHSEMLKFVFNSNTFTRIGFSSVSIY